MSDLGAIVLRESRPGQPGAHLRVPCLQHARAASARHVRPGLFLSDKFCSCNVHVTVCRTGMDGLGKPRSKDMAKDMGHGWVRLRAGDDSGDKPLYFNAGMQLASWLSPQQRAGWDEVPSTRVVTLKRDWQGSSAGGGLRCVRVPSCSSDNIVAPTRWPRFSFNVCTGCPAAA